MHAAAAAKSFQSCPTLCDPIDGSPPGSTIPGIFQARILEWVVVSFSRVMAYDRFVAICSPLRYPISMRPSVCALLMLGCYCGGSFNSIVQTPLTFSLPFCGSNHIDHFHCDVPPLLKLACADML